jgi:uncharacterized protein (DUF362 family)
MEAKRCRGHLVAVVKQKAAYYPSRPPFHPPATFPEFQRVFPPTLVCEPNPVYDAVRESFHLLGYDEPHFGCDSWNPLGGLINPGDTVMLKPNMLSHKHSLNDDWDYCITHGSVIRPVVDYVYLALQGKGRIIIADGPQHDSDMYKMVERLGIREMQEFYQRVRGFSIELLDLRDEKWIETDGIYTETVRLPGDPAGNLIFDLGGESMFAALDQKSPRFYGCHYDIKETQSHHSMGKHEYSICRTPISADVFINIPKMKTHKKCGLTVNLKSVVGGLNANKNYLPHYVLGAPEEGGDQFNKRTMRTTWENAVVVNAKARLNRGDPLIQYLARRLKKVAYRIFGSTEEVVRSGNWHGNDTVWRMCLDLNRILMYGQPNGTLDRQRRKRYFSVVDGIFAMEGNGPISGTKRECGLIIAGDNPVSVDAVCARLMGFDEQKIKLISSCYNDQHPFPLFDGSLEDVKCTSNQLQWNGPVSAWKTEDTLRFKPHFGWKEHIELAQNGFSRSAKPAAGF